MSAILRPGHGLVFMKVGTHARETLPDIIARKRRELDKAGVIFWGYGGNTCHPLTFVQPFAKNHAAAGEDVFLIMEKMDSRHFAEPEVAKDYSDDGVTWHDVPKGVEVRGSRYAMVLGSLEEKEFDVDLTALSVASGASRGRTAFQYLKGRVDKGCFDVLDSGHVPEPNQTKRISLVARLKAPYAVFLR